MVAQKLAPGGAYFPAPQMSQLVLPPVDAFPAAHGLHSELLVSVHWRLTYLPMPQTVQLVHEDLPLSGWKVAPPSHDVQLSDPPTLNFPGSQVTHSWFTWSAKSPGPQ